MFFHSEDKKKDSRASSSSIDSSPQNKETYVGRTFAEDKDTTAFPLSVRRFQKALSTILRDESSTEYVHPSSNKQQIEEEQDSVTSSSKHIQKEIEDLLLIVSLFEKKEISFSHMREEAIFSEKENTADYLGLTEAEEQSENDEYDEILNDEASTLVETRSSLISSQETLSDESDYHAISDFCKDVSHEDEDDVIFAGTNKKLQVIHEITKRKENEAVDSIRTSIASNWYFRIFKSLYSFIKNSLGQLTEETREKFASLFKAHTLTATSVGVLESLPVYYSHIASLGEAETVCANICFCIATSPCSESACERLFSRLKRIVGDHRHSLSFDSLNSLLLL
ncbi:uncharacterized protein MONOS_13955 [Monocercomonoides exilis]|uniref:uncharacterized protein n=1 Tax=Monocercomonoides exilis TaxID=2049356 RepID=UPI003559A79D|nr:hypothetical protein MONOS_13955 [Monocercomonoides exilis]|eukprot:MONOS_13955.1-p1 / transcript=MONOS_13955.1 / gene=MONOS_13955 / organism=Monocercomonoides_exilis_PA203 / gene_product=unspecified product / transcript_product=unspecified product / location=Mono_scaffold00910:13297-14410(+) / protein_length=339 / sequence_SO=supercontig / SO=protein_coding / is_pseudo=false